jgi:hypothetical protein
VQHGMPLCRSVLAQHLRSHTAKISWTWGRCASYPTRGSPRVICTAADYVLHNVPTAHVHAMSPATVVVALGLLVPITLHLHWHSLTHVQAPSSHLTHTTTITIGRSITDAWLQHANAPLGFSNIHPPRECH